MSRLSKIMQIKSSEEREIALKIYAKETGVSVSHLVNQRTGRINEPELVDRIRKAEEHNRNVKIGIAGSLIAVSGIIWSIWYSLLIYPPKYVFDYSRLKLKANISQNYADFELNFVLRNVNRGDGDITKPSLVITAEGSDEKYEIQPFTKFMADTNTSNNVTTYTIKDTGRILHVRGYGIVDEIIEYKVYKEGLTSGYRKRDVEILKFLNANRHKLKFDIQGYPYKRAVVSTVTDF
jgi:hypothetical protein